MTKTIDLLVESCLTDLLPPVPVIADYFGWENVSNDENLSVILARYD
jgi:hypothetical protein